MNSRYKPNLILSQFNPLFHWDSFFSIFSFFSKVILICFILCWSVWFDFDSLNAQEKQATSCADLTSPKDSVEVKELLDCIKKVRLENEARRKADRIKKFYDASVAMSDKLAVRIKDEPPTYIRTGSKMYPASVKYTEQILNENKAPAAANSPTAADDKEK